MQKDTHTGSESISGTANYLPKSASTHGQPALPEQLRVLVVDDETFNQSLMQYLMGRWDLHFACNGAEALELLKEHSYDLILLDLEMPVIDGYVTASRMRSQHGVNAPIIAVSATADPDARDKASAAGIDDFLAKPFYPGDLFRMIRKNLNQYREARI